MKQIIPILALTALTSCTLTNTEQFPKETTVVPDISVEQEYDRELSTLVDTSSVVDLSANFDQFGASLFAEVRKDHQGSNMMISPYSISTALSMTMNGSAGATTTELLATLSLQNATLKEVNSYNSVTAHKLTDLGPITFNSANSIWATERYTPLKRSFHEVITDYYLADIFPLTDVETVNGWISDKTNGKIPKMLSQLSDNTAMLLVNAVYFLGNWRTKFDPDNTRDQAFTLADGSTTTVKMMSLDEKEEQYLYKRGKGYEALALPYKDEKTSLYLFLPDSGIALDSFIVNSVTTGTNGGYYKRVLNESTYEYDTVWQADAEETLFSHFTNQSASISLPRFKFDTDAPLKTTLIAMGLDTAFTPESDFSNFATDRNPWINDVLHKSFIEVNETGTEAAAATVVDVTDSAIMDKVYFRANRPFFFVIRNATTNTTLFMGQVYNPAQ